MNEGVEESDERLMARVAQGDREAFHALHRRYATLLVSIAFKSLGAETAAEILQETLLSVWLKAKTYDERKGPFRPWLLQIAHRRILNELRSRSRRPQRAAYDDGELDEFASPQIDVSEALWNDSKVRAVHAALDVLPKNQREALNLAFYEDLSQSQIAAHLQVPLGTVKTRMRTALRSLRVTLVSLVGAALVAVSVGWFAAQQEFNRRTAFAQRILTMTTASDQTILHLARVEGFSAGTHGSYRSELGNSLAAIALHEFVPPPHGAFYEAWVLRMGHWIPVGTTDRIDAEGNGLIVADTPLVKTLPDDIKVTVERGSALVPSGHTVIEWKAPSE